MRIGIDGRELLNQRTGVGRYLAALCAQWLTLPDQDGIEFLVYTPTRDGGLADLGPPFDDAPPGSFQHRPIAGHPGTWWEQVQLPTVANQDALDVFFAPAYSASLRLAASTVVTMHDVSFAAHPEWFRWREGVRRRWLARQTMARARTVITVSDFSRGEILRYFDVPPSQVHVVRSGIQARSARPQEATGALVLYVGSVFNRRHLPTLIRALPKVRTLVPDAELAIVGTDRTHPRQDLAALAVHTGVRDHVTLRAYVTEDELVALYDQARVFVFLSEYEGFGLTPLEALAAGVPIVVAETPVAHELYAEAALYVPATDVAATADAVIALLTDASLRARQRDHARAVLQRFTWARAARETLAVLEEAARASR